MHSSPDQPEPQTTPSPEGDGLGPSLLGSLDVARREVLRRKLARLEAQGPELQAAVRKAKRDWDEQSGDLLAHPDFGLGLAVSPEILEPEQVPEVAQNTFPLRGGRFVRLRLDTEPSSSSEWSRRCAQRRQQFQTLETDWFAADQALQRWKAKREALRHRLTQAGEEAEPTQIQEFVFEGNRRLLCHPEVDPQWVARSRRFLEALPSHHWLDLEQVELRPPGDEFELLPDPSSGHILKIRKAARFHRRQLCLFPSDPNRGLQLLAFQLAWRLWWRALPLRSKTTWRGYWKSWRGQGAIERGEDAVSGFVAAYGQFYLQPGDLDGETRHWLKQVLAGLEMEPEE
ncbi:MAG: hypothetical protein DWQ01_12260 [Planctomycetota bacterium]|nr:MAG: hypothetical protein DWQ01_12260 [Planctomycetota bacterium]